MENLQNVLFLSELFYPHGGGAELATGLYANLLSEERDFNIRVITNRFEGEPETTKDPERNLTIYRLQLFKNATSVKYSILKKLNVLLSDFMKKQIQWADAVYIPRYWFSGALVAKSLHRPVIVHLHDSIFACPLALYFNENTNAICERSPSCSTRCIYLYEMKRGRKLIDVIESTTLNFTLFPILRKMIQLGDAVICTSKKQWQIINDSSSLLGRKTNVVYNPLPQTELVDIRADDFGYFGGPNPMKGYHVLLRALEEVESSLIVRGTNFPQESSNTQPVTSHRNFFPQERVRYEALDTFYEKIRSVIFPSIVQEPLPYVVSEAILKGRLVIASRIGGIPEQVEGCKGTLLFNAGNYHQLADGIESVNALKRESIVDLGIRNRQIFLKRFNNTRTLEAFKSIIRRALSNPS